MVLLIVMMNLSIRTFLSVLGQTPRSTSIDFAYWKWVVLVGVAAVVVFYVLKRVADVVVDRKTDKLIREVEDEENNRIKNEKV